MRYVRLEDAVRFCGVPQELLEALLDDELVLALKDELRARLRDRDLLGPRGFLPGP